MIHLGLANNREESEQKLAATRRKASKGEVRWVEYDVLHIESATRSTLVIFAVFTGYKRSIEKIDIY